ncbi:TOPRS ligase, partial [Nyctibius bracteatus]|nr:TOPRS ligase [Nyctibius bracteatus]
MAAEEEWSCPICRDARDDVAYALPCLHQFCQRCILRWAKRKTDCPLCRGPLKKFKLPVQGDDSIQCFITASIGLQDASSQADTAPGRLDDSSPHGPAASPPMPSPAEQGTVGTDVGATVGGLLPEVWAELFQAQRHLFDPVLPWLRREVEAIDGSEWWRSAESSILHALCVYGPDREVMVQVLQDYLKEYAAALVPGIVNIIMCQCSEEAQKLLHSYAAVEEDDSSAASFSSTSSWAGTPDSILAPSSSPEGPEVEEEAGTSEAALREHPSHPPSVLAGPSAPGCSRSTSAPGQGSHPSPRGPWCPRKWGGSIPQYSPQPFKRPCPEAS